MRSNNNIDKITGAMLDSSLFYGRKRMKKKVSFKKEEKKTLYRCPKFQKCVMDCHHRVPHEHDRWCNSTHIDDILSNSPECPNCVPELASDCTFFEEDFEIE